MGFGSFFTKLLKCVGKFFIKLFQTDEFQQLVKDLAPIALKLVETATNLDLDGDGKRKHVVAELLNEAKRKGIECATRYANLIVELAYNEFINSQIK